MLIHPREMRYHEEDTGQPAPVMDAPAVDPSTDTAAELERTRVALKLANAESAKRRKRLEELEAAEQERAQAELSETDRLKKQLDEAEAKHAAVQARLNAELIKSAAASAAQGLQLPFAGTTALDDAVALGAFADLEIGSDGKVSGINDAIKSLHKARPYLFGTPMQAPDINGGARGNGQGPLITDEERAAVRRRYQATF